MRHTLIRAAVCAILVIGATRALAVPTGPVATRTGARGINNKGAEPNCTTCHTPDLNGLPPGINQPGGSIQILGVPPTYTPSSIYTLTVRLQHDWNPLPVDLMRWGFQLQACTAGVGDSAGTWVLTPNVPPDSFKIVKAVSTSVYKNRRYVDQAGWLITDERPGGPTHFGETGPVEWHVKWQAPPGDSGKIYFFAAGNSTNGDDLCFDSGDFIFTTSESTVAGASADVPQLPSGLRTALGAPVPNPMKGRTDFAFSISKGGIVDVAVFDLTGRRVATLMHEFREAGTHQSFWSGRTDGGQPLRNSVYFVRLSSPDRRSITRKIILER
jgi:hypothetical protein